MKEILSIVILFLFSLSIFSQNLENQNLDTLKFVSVYTKKDSNNKFIFQRDTIIIGNSSIKKTYVKEKNKPVELIRIEYSSNGKKDSLITFINHKRIRVEKWTDDNLTITNFWQTDTNYNRLTKNGYIYFKRNFKCGSIMYDKNIPPLDFYRCYTKNKNYSFKIEFFCNNKKVFKYKKDKKLFRPYFVIKKEYRLIDDNGRLLKTKSILKKRNRKTIADKTNYKYKNGLLIEKLTKSKNEYNRIKVIYFYNSENKLIREQFFSLKTGNEIKNTYYKYGENDLIKEIKTTEIPHNENKIIDTYVSNYIYSNNNKLITKLIKRYNIYQKRYDYTKIEYK